MTTRCIITIFLFINNFVVFGQISNKTFIVKYEIGEVFNFKKSILSLSFDDGAINNFTIVVPLLNQYNIPATFYINTDRIDQNYLNSILQADLSLHEIGAHTISHPDLTKLSSLDIQKELFESNKTLREVFKSQEVLTFAYPFGSYNKNVITFVKNQYLCARTIKWGYNKLRRFDPFALYGITYGFVNLNQMNKYVDFITKNNVWMIEVFHGLDNVGWRPIKTDSLINHLKFLSSKKSDLWYANIADAFKYLTEIRNARVEILPSQSNIMFKIEDNLSDHIYNHPISLKISIPYDWNYDSLILSNCNKTGIVIKNGIRYISLNVLPNNELAKISINKPNNYYFTDDANNILELCKIKIHPNPFDDKLFVSRYENNTKLNVEIYDLFGNILCHSIITNNYDYIDTQILKNGYYLIKVYNNSIHYCKIIVKN